MCVCVYVFIVCLCHSVHDCSTLYYNFNTLYFHSVCVYVCVFCFEGNLLVCCTGSTALSSFPVCVDPVL